MMRSAQFPLEEQRYPFGTGRVLPFVCCSHSHTPPSSQVCRGRRTDAAKPTQPLRRNQSTQRLQRGHGLRHRALPLRVRLYGRRSSSWGSSTAATSSTFRRSRRPAGPRSCVTGVSANWMKAVLGGKEAAASCSLMFFHIIFRIEQNFIGCWRRGVVHALLREQGGASRTTSSSLVSPLRARAPTRSSRAFRSPSARARSSSPTRRAARSPSRSSRCGSPSASSTASPSSRRRRRRPRRAGEGA